MYTDRRPNSVWALALSSLLKLWQTHTVRQRYEEDVADSKQQKHHSACIVQLVDAGAIELQQIEVDNRVTVGDGSKGCTVEAGRVLADASSVRSRSHIHQEEEVI